MNAPLNNQIAEQLSSVIPAVDRFKALTIVDEIGESHILESFAFRIGGWLNAKLIGNAHSINRMLERDGFDPTKMDASTIKGLMLGPDGDNDRLTELQAVHACLNRIAGWGAVPVMSDTLAFMSKPGKQSRISRELLVAAMNMRKKKVKNVEERVDQLLKIDEAREQAQARELAASAPNTLWMIEHIFAEYGNGDDALDKASDDFIAELDERLLKAARQLSDDAMLNTVRGVGDWSLGDVAILDNVVEALENL